MFGKNVIRVIDTSGHTPACLSFLIGDCLFTGDALFMPDSGTGRCDFPGGSASELYKNIVINVYSLADNTWVYPGHDYQPGGRELKFRATVLEHKSSNRMLPADIDQEAFVKKREGRDSELSAPKLLLPSIQVNMVAGRLPAVDANGKYFIKIPLVLNSL